MLTSITSIVQECHEASAQDRLDFQQTLGKLNNAGIESYIVDLRKSATTYYRPDGEGIELPFPELEAKVGATFDAGSVAAAVRKAQAKAPGYTYRGFCRKIMESGCAGYIVSILGRRVVYFGRTAETHVEHIPG